MRLKSNIGLIILGAVFVTALVPGSAPQGVGDTPGGSYDFREYEQIGHLIYYVPNWPEDRQLTREEWQRALCVAIALQKLNPIDVEMAFLAHLLIERHRAGRGPSAFRGVRVMLLTRIMFDIPDDAKAADRILPCGGRRYVTADPDIEQIDSINAPVGWTDEGPRLTAFHQPPGPIASGGTSSRGLLSEYRYFRQHFPIRAGIEDLCDVKIERWRDVRDLQSEALRKARKASDADDK